MEMEFGTWVRSSDSKIHYFNLPLLVFPGAPDGSGTCDVQALLTWTHERYLPTVKSWLQDTLNPAPSPRFPNSSGGFDLAWCEKQRMPNGDMLAQIRVKRTLSPALDADNLLKMAIEDLPANVYWHDTHGTLLGCNQRQAEQLGLTNPNDIIGRSVWDFLDAPYAKEHARLLEQVIQSKQALTLEEQLELDENPLHVVSTKKPLLSDNGEVLGILGVSLDITNLRATERELAAEKDKLIEALEARTRMLANLQHDIRTPFNGILGLSSHLESIEEDSGKKELLGMVVTSTQRLVDYCNQIIDFTRAEHQSHVVVLNPCNVGQLLEDVHAIYAPAAKHKRNEVVLELGALPETIVTDAFRLQSIVVNLVGNAMKFTSDGLISIRAHTSSSDPTTICISVEDTGIGIPEDKLEIIFEPFEKLHGKALPSAHNQGFGLGLSIVSTYIQSLQGSVTVTSILDQGSTFTVTVPNMESADRLAS